jgi:putative transposase
LSNWAASTSKQRKGPRTGFPRYKTRRSRLSCRFSTGALGLVDADRRHIQLPRIGVVRTHESTRKLAQRIAGGTTRIRSATLSFRRGRWFASFSVEATQTSALVARPDTVVGVDLGVRYLAVLSKPVRDVSDTAGMVPNPAHLEVALSASRRLARHAARRRGPDKRTHTTPSRRWQATQAKLARLHASVCDGRMNALHQLTTALTKRCGVIVIEDLNVAGMLANHRLARRVAGASWGQVRRQLAYKTDWRGGQLIVVGRFYPSSKTCSHCGAVKAKLRLSERDYHCETCGLRMDRDLNAARNLAALAEQTIGEASSPSCGATINEPAGNPHKTSPAGRGYRHGKPLQGNVA